MIILSENNNSSLIIGNPNLIMNSPLGISHGNREFVNLINQLLQ